MVYNIYIDLFGVYTAQAVYPWRHVIGDIKKIPHFKRCIELKGFEGFRAYRV